MKIILPFLCALMLSACSVGLSANGGSNGIGVGLGIGSGISF